MSYNYKNIQNYLINGNTKNKTVKEVADELFVSRSVIYYSLKKMGFDSFTNYNFTKYNSLNNEFSNIPISKKIITDVVACNRLFIYGTHATHIACLYCERQFTNIGIDCKCIDDDSIILRQMKLFKEGDCILLLSTSGENDFINDIIDKITINKIVITKKNSKLGSMLDHGIFYESDLYQLFNPFDREDLYPLITHCQNLLISVKREKEKHN